MKQIPQNIFLNLIPILNNYNYCILRNYEDLPFIENDIDILMNKEHILDFAIELNNKLNSVNAKIVHSAKFSCNSFFILNDKNKQIYHIDIFPKITWRGFNYLSTNDILKNRKKYKNLFIPDEKYEFSELLLTNLLYNKKVKEKYKSRILNLYKHNNKEINIFTKKILGENLSHKLKKHLSNENWIEINKLRIKILAHLCFQNINLKNLFAFYFRIINRYFNYPGVFIVFLGADGSGKSSVINKINVFLSNAFLENHTIHLRTNFLKNLTNENSKIVTAPHSQKNRNFIASIMKLFYFLFDYVFSYIFYIKIKLSKNNLIIFDRYYHDLLIDPKRYRYGAPIWIAKLIGKLIPKPDLWILLDAPADVLQKRKQEVPFEESKRQRNEYLKLANGLKNGYVIDASQKLETVVRNTEDIILNHLEKKTKKRYKL